jgi:hypothetical protein
MTAPAPTRHTALQTRASAELTWRLSQYTGRLGWDSGQLAGHQLEQLRVLLGHAAGHSPFDARRLHGWTRPGSRPATWPGCR